jgi:hypothetical protein
MKTLLTLLLFLPLISVAQSKPELVATIHEKDFIAEGIAYNPADKSFYVGSIHKNKIVKISSSGKITDFVSSHQDSIGQLVGLRIDEAKQHLWACNNEGEEIVDGKSQMYQYNLKTGKLIRKYSYQAQGETHLFNDAVLLNGNVYVSDSEFKAVYKIDPIAGKLELFLQSDQLRYANGITTIPGTSTLVVSSSNGLASINVETKAISFIPFSSYYIIGIDGLYFYKDSFIGIQNVTYPASINRYYLNSTKDSIVKASLLLADDADFDVPTTGAIVDDWLYYIANSQLSNYSKGVVEDPKKLEDTRIMRIKIR